MQQGYIKCRNSIFVPIFYMFLKVFWDQSAKKDLCFMYMQLYVYTVAYMLIWKENTAMNVG